MASRRDSERLVQMALEREFGTSFSEKRMQLGKTLDGGEAHKKFDVVSDRGDIVAMVKDYSAENKNGNRTRLARVSHDLLLLHIVDAEVKFMYLSGPFFDWFAGAYDAIVPEDIEVRTLPS